MSKQFKGKLEIQKGEITTISLDAKSGNLTLGDGVEGDISVKNKNGDIIIRLASNYGKIFINKVVDGTEEKIIELNHSGRVTIGGNSVDAKMNMRNKGNRTIFFADAKTGVFSVGGGSTSSGTIGKQGTFRVKDFFGRTTIEAKGQKGEIKTKGKIYANGLVSKNAVKVVGGITCNALDSKAQIKAASRILGGSLESKGTIKAASTIYGKTIEAKEKIKSKKAIEADGNIISKKSVICENVILNGISTSSSSGDVIIGTSESYNFDANTLINIKNRLSVIEAKLRNANL